MDFQKLNNWLTLTANFGVLLGIVFLAQEINQNTAVMQSTAYQNRTEALQNTFAMITDSEVLTSGLAKIGWFGGNCNPDETLLRNLSPEELIAVQAFLRAQWFRFDNSIYQYDAGILDNAGYSSGTMNALASYIPWWDLFDVRQAHGARDVLREFGFDEHQFSCLL